MATSAQKCLSFTPCLDGEYRVLEYRAPKRVFGAGCARDDTFPALHQFDKQVVLAL